MSKKLLMMVTVTMVIMSCKTSYQVVSIERSRILVDARYDHHQDEKAVAFLTHYERIVDSIMSPVVGQSAKYMKPHRPESELSNLITDIMVWAAKDYNEQVDFGVYNMGGMRADLPKGDVTYGNVLDIAPFENKIAFATLSGAEVLELFSQMASIGGDGVSHSVRMVITKDGQLVSTTLNGEPIDSQKDYRFVTIDYLLGGTDKMVAFKKSRDIHSPQATEDTSRLIIMKYFREQMSQGKVVDAEIEGRVIVQK